MSFSTVGDGVADATEVLQQELERGGEIRIPRGNYRITRTLLVSGRYNTKNPDLFAADAYSGAVLNFSNVTGLKLHGMVIANSVTFNIRMCKINDFEIRDIGFQSDHPGFNQDGLHFGGFVRDGVIENIRAITRGANDG